MTTSMLRRHRNVQVAGLIAVLSIVISTALCGIASAVTANGKIAFVSTRDGNREIYTMNADGSNPQRLTSNAAADTEPAWSPDGTQIAFVSTRDDDDGEIYTMNADGTGVRRLTHYIFEDSSPAWSPDGTRIAFETRASGLDVYTMYSTSGDLGALVRLTSNSAFDGDPVYSPNGARVAFTSSRSGTSQLYTMDSVNGDISLRRLTTASITHRDPDWQPGGSTILFAYDRTGFNTLNDIWHVDADGAGVEGALTLSPAVHETSPAWSPDAAKFTYSSDQSGSDQIYSADADGASPQRITSTASDETQPSWQQVDAEPTPVGETPGDGSHNEQTDQSPPSINGLRAHVKRKRIRRSKKAKRNIKVSYKLSEVATVDFTLLEVRRASGRRCRKSRRRSRCLRTKVVATFDHVGAAGMNATSRRLSRRMRMVKRVRFRLSAVATDAAGNKSREATVSFKGR